MQDKWVLGADYDGGFFAYCPKEFSVIIQKDFFLENKRGEIIAFDNNNLAKIFVRMYRIKNTCNIVSIIRDELIIKARKDQKKIILTKEDGTRVVCWFKNDWY